MRLIFVAILIIVAGCSASAKVGNVETEAHIKIVKEGAGAPRDYPPVQPAGQNGPDRGHV